ncbi:MAG: HD domain-containing protein [bacterium]|nr:HD domain-containing protein [bacterium]
MPVRVENDLAVASRGSLSRVSPIMGETGKLEGVVITTKNGIQSVASEEFEERRTPYYLAERYYMFPPKYTEVLKSWVKAGIIQAGREAGEVFALIQELCDPVTGYHQRRVEQIAHDIAKRLGYKDTALNEVALAGRLHDSGKASTPKDILRKPALLTPEELEDVMYEHPKVGRMIVHALGCSEVVKDAVEQHHKDARGKGYPKSVTREDLTQEGQIVRVADEIDRAANFCYYPKPLKGVRAMKIEFVQGVMERRYFPEVLVAAAGALLVDHRRWKDIQSLQPPLPLLRAASGLSYYPATNF